MAQNSLSEVSLTRTPKPEMESEAEKDEEINARSWQMELGAERCPLFKSLEKRGRGRKKNNGKERLTVWTHAINCRALWKVVGTLGLSNKSLAKKNLLVRKHVRSLILSQSFGAQFWVKVLGIFNHALLKSDYVETKLEQKRTKRKKIAINLCLGDRAIITFALTNVFGPWPFLSPPAIHLRLHSSCNFHSDNLIKRPKGAEMSCRERANVAKVSFVRRF